MADYSIWMLGKSNISVSGGQDLSGFTQGDGSHLMGETITLNNNSWEEVDVTDNETFFDDSDGNQRLDGAQTIDGVSYASGRKVEAEYTLTVTDGTNTYTLIGFNVNEPGGGPAYGTVEGLAFIGEFPPIGVPLTVVGTAEGPKRSTDASSYAVPPCFLAGTLIDTPDGPRRVETLQPGDLVLTRDDGPRKLKWVGMVTLNPEELAVAPNLRPIEISANALGPGSPDRPMSVSPQHRILLEGWRSQLLCGGVETLAAAVHLVNDHSIRRAAITGAVTYVHIMFDRHQIVSAHGLASESFRPGPMVLGSLDAAARNELLTLFPELSSAEPESMAPVRPLLSGWEARLLRRAEAP